MSTEFLQLHDFQGFDERIEVDTSEGKRHRLLIGKNGSQIKLTESTFQLLRFLRNGGTIEGFAETLSRQTRKPVSVEELNTAYLRVAEKIRAIEDAAQRAKLPALFWVRLKILPSSAVVPLARLLSAAFAPGAVGPLLLVALGGMAFVLWGGQSMRLAEGAFFPAYGLFLLALVMHELGHAAACLRFGATPGEIGLAIYLIYPAFYSDVSPAWRLRRWQRVVVDLAGAYFQFLVSAAYIAAFLVTGNEIWWLAVLMITSSSVFMLNPIFKFDGYWVLADALGVTNLSRQPRRIVQHFYHRLRHRPTDPLPWPTWITILLAVYSVVSFTFWAYFLFHLFPVFLHRLSNVPGQLAGIGRELGASPHLVSWHQLRGFLISMFFLFLGGLMIWRLLGKPLFRLAVRGLRA